MSGEGKGGEQSPPGGFDGNEASISWGGKEIFRAKARPSQLKQIDDAMFARIIAATGLPAAPRADHHRRNLFMSVHLLAEAIEPYTLLPGADELHALRYAAITLRNLCKEYVSKDAGPRSAEPPFLLIGQLHHLAEWAERNARFSEKPRGNVRSPWLEPSLQDMRGIFIAVFASTGSEGQMVAPATDNDSGTGPSPAFNSFVRASLHELAGLPVKSDWLRDVMRKKPTKRGK
ncbi:hypothetical protein [Acidiphilium acidophilum]|uniref:hypothetical protein n=1 Tax=Acidiphilium acidophilum TaxID=76588 RepID=UPI002E8E61DF|nr:hypothetical protein [Acidiphilium acidophilum]